MQIQIHLYPSIIIKLKLIGQIRVQNQVFTRSTLETRNQKTETNLTGMESNRIQKQLDIEYYQETVTSFSDVNTCSFSSQLEN